MEHKPFSIQEQLRTACRTWAALLAIAGNSAQALDFAGGTGEPNDPYQIATAAHLVALGNDPNLWDKHFILTRDLDMKDIDPNAMHPIGGRGRHAFRGVFDGRGHAVVNLHMWRTDDFWVGLFKEIQENSASSHPFATGHIRNLHLRSVDVRGARVVGALVGEFGSGLITNCSVTGSVTGKNSVGGLVGWGHGELTRCRAAVDVRGDVAVGGLIGDMWGATVQCSSSGSVHGRANVGGLIGSNAFAFFSGSTTEGSRPDVSAFKAKTMQCGSCSSVTGIEGTGGLIGVAFGAGAVEDCYALGPVDGTTRVGGLIGVATGCCVVRCFSAGYIKGKVHTGGLIGENEPVENAERLVRYPPCQFIVEEIRDASSSRDGWKWLLVYRPAILSCFWDGDASGTARGLGSGADAQGGLTRLTTAEMRTAAPFTNFGWDFESVWTIEQGEPYPRLRWEPDPAKRLTVSRPE